MKTQLIMNERKYENLIKLNLVKKMKILLNTIFGTLYCSEWDVTSVENFLILLIFDG